MDFTYTNQFANFVMVVHGMYGVRLNEVGNDVHARSSLCKH